MPHTTAYSVPLYSGSRTLPMPGNCSAIAVVGMACRFPQEAENPEKFWQLLLHGRSALTEFPTHKLNIDAHYHPDPAHGGTMSCKSAHFLKDSGYTFDAPFFNISKTEAMTMDPQQRLLMENVYEALENAGIPVETISGTETSVFVGAFTNDFQTILNIDPEAPAKYAPTGNSNSILSNRVSWFYDLKGCSLTLDTACSSSLVAVHLACESLRTGNASMSIVGGVNVIEQPQALYRMSKLGFLSPDGKCYSFDHRGNGYSRGEGVGVVLLKTLHKALEDGDTIRAVIRASGVNQDGRTPGLTVPNKSAQEGLIRSVYHAAGLDLAETDYVEAHGTGTAQGDPIEAGAIAAAWSGRVSDVPLYVGAVKSNIGHLEGASGVAALIKTVMALEKAVIPRNINFEKVNPKISPDEWNIKFPIQPMPWPDTDIRRASINSFGFGGTNAHVVVDDAYNYLRLHRLEGKHRSVHSSPSANALLLLSEDINGVELEENSKLTNGNGSATSNAEGDSREDALSSVVSMPLVTNGMKARIFVFSSSDQSGIKRIADTYSTYLADVSNPLGGQYLDDLAYTLAEKRTLFPWRSAVVASSKDGLVKELPGLARATRQVRKSNTSKTGFVFTGQGAQWPEMGKDLLVYDVFRQSLEDASAYLQEIGCSWILIDEICRDSENSNIDRPEVSQATCTALQVALVDLLRSWKVVPSRVIGHSSGEIAAAYCSGALDRESAWRIAYYRGVVSGRIAGQGGAMLAVGVGEAVLQPYLERIDQELDGELTIACYNSPGNLTVSGDEKKIDSLAVSLRADGIFCKKLNVRNAYHSSYMKAVADDYKQLIGEVSAAPADPRNGTVAFSSVTGGEIPIRTMQSAQYWLDNLLSPVRFSSSLAAMASTGSAKKAKLRVDRGSDTSLQDLIEIGPHPALQSAIREILAQNASSSAMEYHFLIRRKTSGIETTLSTVAKLFCSGHVVDLFAVNHTSHAADGEDFVHPQILVDLPPYPFNHSQTYWPESRLSKNFRFRTHPRHDLLGAPVSDWDRNDPKWRQLLRVSESPWLRDHKVTGRIVYPGVGYIVMAIEAVRQLYEAQEAKITAFCLRDISIRSALQVPETEEGVDVMLSMPAAPESSLLDSAVWRQFKVISYNPNTNDWTEHCRGLIKAKMESAANALRAENTSEDPEVRRQQVENQRSKCTEPFDMGRAYAELETIGLSFGPLFKNLSNVRQGSSSGEATGQITVPNIAAVMPKTFTHPHIIHPATMDSMMHLFLAAIQDGVSQSRLTEPMVPVFIGEVWVAKNLDASPGTVLCGYGSAEKMAHKKFRGSISVWDEEWADCKVRFSGIQFVPLQSSSATSQKRQVSFNVEWKPDIDLLDRRECEQYLQASVKPIKYDIATVYKMAEAFNLASILYITEALEQLEGSNLDGLPQHLQRYLAWMRYQAEGFRQGQILHQRPEWKLVMRSSDLREKLLTEVEKTGPEGQLTNRMGTHIVPILQQEADALQLMFGDSLLDSYYRELHGTENIHQLFRSYLDLYSFKQANLKILEIGAGTGGTTLPVLDALCPPDGFPRVTKYTYTDISPGFFEKAKSKFRSYLHIIEFRRLDIEKDPVTQGFHEEEYDMVIASNVLHATADIANTLGNVRKLLRPGGTLLLQEAVNPALLSGPLAFGTLPGWWLGNEESRGLWPILDESQWDSALRASGFDGNDLVLKDHVDQKIHAQSLIVATAQSRSPLGAQINPDNVAVIIVPPCSSSPLALAVEKTLLDLAVRDVKVVGDQAGLAQTDFKESICIVLQELEVPIFKDISEGDFHRLRRLLTTCKGLLWVTGNTIQCPDLGLATGLIRSIRWERDLDDSNLVTLSFESLDAPVDALARQIARVFDSQFLQLSNQRHAEYLISGETISINRLVNAPYLDDYFSTRLYGPVAVPQPLGASTNRALKLTTDAPGLLNRLQFVDCPVYASPLDAHDVEVSIAATGLNFRDVMSAMGEVAGDILGAEGAGTVTRVGAGVTSVRAGDRVALLASRTGCFATRARTVKAAVVRLPDNVSFEEAAGMPVIACTAYYSIVHLGRLREGESILIHAAAGGVGQAAIMLAQHLGANIYATVSTVDKKKVLVETYGIPEDHVLYSRDISFGDDIMRLTKHRGVDVVLNSLAGEALRVSWNCVAPFGRFIEIGKRDIYSNSRLEMFPFSKNITFASCDLETVMKLDQPLTARLLQDAMRLWSEGVFRKTVPLNVFSYSDIESSFRLLQSGRHTGKIVLMARNDDVVSVIPPPVPEYRFPGDASYVLAGGLGGLGRSIANWMVSQGARHLIFLSRSGDSAEEAQKLLRELEGRGCRTAVFACDISNAKRLEQVMTECASNMPPIRGCIQGAMQLKDSAFETMSYADFAAAIRPKVHGSWNLHTYLPPDLDFFIMLSSICGLIGNRGQSNYAAGNTYQDSLARFRRTNGMTASTIDLGSMLSVGFIAEHAETVNPYALAAETIREDEFHAMLEYHIDPRNRAAPAQVAVGLATKAAFAKKGIPEPSFLRHPLFALLQSASSRFDGEDDEDESLAALRLALRAAKSAEEAVALVVEMLVKRLASVMTLPAEDIDPSKPVHYYGVDSLVAVEFRNWLSKNLEAEIEVLDIMGDGSIIQLSEKIVNSSKMLAFREGSGEQS